jgi:hypothetical protein
MSNQYDKNGKAPPASNPISELAGVHRNWSLGLAASVVVSSLLGMSGCAGHDPEHESEAVSTSATPAVQDESVAATSQATVTTLNMVLPKGILPGQVLISGTNGVQIGDRSRVSGGQISNTGTAELNFGVDARVTKARTTSVGLVRARGTNDKTAWIDGAVVTANTLIKENKAQVAGPVTEHATITTANFPRAVDFPTAAGSDVIVQNGVTRPLTPGTYNNVTVNNGCTLNLAPGKYYITNLNFEAGSKVVYQNANKPVELFVKTKILFKGTVSEQATGATAGNVMATYLGTTEAFLESPWIGTLFAPSAPITLGPLNNAAKKHRGAFFGKSVQVRPDTRVDYLPFPSYLITDVTVSTTTPCSNQPVLVTATTRTPSDATGTLPEVSVNGSPASATATGARRTVQFVGTGPRKILVTARSGNVSASRMIDVNVGTCAQKYPRLVVTSAPRPYEVEFAVTNPSDVAGTGLKYAWVFGDGQQLETTDPWVSHSYAGSVNATTADLVFEATLTVKRTGQPDLVVPKSVVIRNMYALMAARGFVRPLVTTDSRLSYNDRALEGSFTLRNLETGAINFTKQQVQRQFCDPDKAPVNEPAETIAVTLAGGASQSQQVRFDRHVFGRDVCGIRVSWTGKTSTNLNAVVDVNFDTPSPLLVNTPVTDAATKTLLNQLVGAGKVSNSERITLEELEALKKKGKITSVPPVSTASGGVLGGAEDLLGQPCDPTIASDHPELSCQATDDWTITPPMVRNGLKGDLLLVSACEQIGMMLRKMTPRQVYSHEAMMTRNYFRIAENTAAVTYMMTGANGLGDLLNGDLLKYAWPGSIQQTVATAFSQLNLPDPEGKLQVITTLHPEAARCLADEDPAPALIVRPHPSNEATARPTLSQLADWEFDPANHTHYRLFAYSQSNIAFDGNQNFSGGNFKSPHDNTLPAVSSTFHWLAAKKNDVTLEGTALETLTRPFKGGTDEAALGALLPTGTQGIVDGLYGYTVDDRRRGAEYIYSSTYNMVATMQDSVLYSMLGWSADVGAGLIDFFSGDLSTQTDAIAGQVTSCFGADYCHAADDPACPCFLVQVGTDDGGSAVYEQQCPPNMTDREQAACSTTYTRSNPGEGTAVSPDNFLFWDAPNYGYYEYLSYRSGEFDRVHRWVANPGTTGSCTGTVVLADGTTPAVDATVVMQNSSVGTDASGTFTFNALTAGTYEVKAQAQAMDGTTLWDTDVTTVQANGSCTPVKLILTEDGPFEDLKPIVVAKRKVTFSGTLKITDDENFSDEHWGSDGNLNGVCEVSPANRRVVLHSADLFGGESNPCAGGEVNTNLEIICELDENDLSNQNVRVTIKVDSVEGNNCNGGSDIFDDRQEDTDSFGPTLLTDGEVVPDHAMHTFMSGAGSADVNVTITNGVGDNITINPLKEENRRKVIFDGTVDLNDSEWAASDEKASETFHSECYVDPLDPEDEIEWLSTCAGGEVHATMKITCSLAPDAKAVTVKTEVKLFEGTTCTATDEDGKANRSTQPIDPCAGDPASCAGVSLNLPESGDVLEVDNDDEGGKDSVKLNVKIKNVQQNSIVVGP